MQYRFENGEAVDAVIHIKDKLLPIDSKFSTIIINVVLMLRMMMTKNTMPRSSKGPQNAYN